MHNSSRPDNIQQHQFARDGLAASAERHNVEVDLRSMEIGLGPRCFRRLWAIARSDEVDVGGDNDAQLIHVAEG